MNPKALVSAALQGRAIPRVPAGPLAVHFCARVGGHTLRRYSTDGGVLADCVLRYHERFRPDAVWLSADTWVNAEAMGARVGASDDDQPLGGVGPPTVASSADIERIPAPDVSSQGRYPLMLEALATIVREIGREVFVVACFDQYPFSLAAAMMGINELMLKLVDDPPFVDALMHRCAEYTVAYGRALAAGGADMLSGGDSPASLIGPEYYQRFALPAEQAVIARLKSGTGKPVSLHICGKALPLLPLMRKSGADVLELEVDLAEACEVAGPDIAIWGNLDPAGVLRTGTPAQVWVEAEKTLETVRQAGHGRFVLSSGCTLSVDTPYENLDTLCRASGASQPRS